MTSATPNADLEAADWFARLQGEPDLEAWQAFQAWLEADPDHAVAYEAVEALWLDLDSPDLDRPPAREAAMTAAPKVVALDARRMPLRRSVWVGMAGVAAAAAAVAIAVLPRQTSSSTDYATTVGETRKVVLADGSQLTLSGASHIRTRITSDRREVALLAGEASFDVTHEPNRVFTVEAGARKVQVLGTEFNVARDGAALVVTVRRGAVSVSDHDAPTYRVAQGQALTADDGQPTVVVPVDPDEAFAWHDGRLIFNRTPLPQVAASLNRVVRTPIRVAPDARALTVTAVLAVDDEEQMMRRLEMFSPLRAERSGKEIVLHSRAARP